MSALPAGWAWTTLGEIGEWRGGGTPSKRVERYWDGDIPWVSPKDMKVERIRDTLDHISREAVAESSTTLVPAGSVLVVTRSGILSHTLPVAVAEREVALNQDLKALVPVDGVVSEYVAWGLRAHAQQILRECSKAGTTVANLETSRLLGFRIPLAPLNEQRRIVAAIEEHLSRLDAADASLGAAERKLSVARRSIREAEFDGQWDRVPLGEVVDNLDSQRVPVNRTERANRPGTVPYYGATGQVGWIDAPLFNEELCLVGEDGAPFLDADKDKAYVIDGPSWVNNHAHVLRALAGITSNRYLKHALDAVDYEPFVNGTTRLKLTKRALNQIPIPVPPLEEQRRIVAEVEEKLSVIDAMRASIANAQRRSTALRAAILERAFRGELVPQDPADEPAEALLARIRAKLDP